MGHKFAGFRSDLGGVVSAARADHWPKDFHFSDYIGWVDGQPIADRNALLEIYERTPVGQVLEHRGLRGAEPFTVSAPVQVFTWRDFLDSTLPFLLFGLAFGALGVFIGYKGRHQPEARLFSMFCAAMLLAAVGNALADFYTPIVALNGLSGALVGALPIALAGRLGPERRAIWWPLATAVAGSLISYWQLPAGSVAIIGVEGMNRAWTFWWLTSTYWPLIGFAIFLAMMGRNVRRIDPNSLQGRQSRIIFYGAMASFLPVILVWSPFMFGGSVDPILGPLALSCLTLFPVAVTFAVLRYRLFEIDIIIRRTLTYGILAGGLAAVYLAGMSLAVSLLDAAASEQVRFGLLLGLVMVFDPIRRWLQAQLDRVFDRGRLDTTAVQRLINRRAIEHRDTSQTLEGIARDVAEALKLSRCAIALTKDDQVWTVAGDPELLGTCFLVKELPKPSHWDRRSHPEFAWPDGVEALVKVTLRDRLVALLLLGEKRSHESLSGQDFDYLGLILGQIGVLLSYTQVLDRQASVDREMQKLLQRVTELNDLRASFGIIAGHELRTPLMVIQGHAEALMAGMFGNLDEVQHESVASIFKSARNLSLQINSYLDLIALRENRLVLRRNAVDLGAQIHEVLGIWHEAIEQKGLSLRVDAEPGALALADPRRFKQLVKQLLANAVKYTPQGGSLWIGVHAEAASIKVQIRDSGPGISEAQLEQAFQEFVQLEEPTQRDHGGLGIGLPLAKGLAEAMGGWLAYSPGPEGGSIFTLALPAAPLPSDHPVPLRPMDLKASLEPPLDAGSLERSGPAQRRERLGLGDVVYERHDSGEGGEQA